MPASEPALATGRIGRASEVVPEAAGTSPVAVVWCRQVDNEAESPGYTTVPEEFPGLSETLEVIRIVGHLTVNVADTHDYWDPDPSQPLSYYPNLFLYPAFGGRYTCLGRMFLSTEDRPRLGMKTLVLDTAQLLATGDFGGTILRWHASMGGSRSDGRPAPVPDPRLYDLLGEGFLFHKGATDPVVAIGSDDWEAAVQVVLDLIRSLPASLVALGAILVFPYFLPQPKTNLHEFTEQLPLSLALMRIPRGEAAGDRHDKRMASWESSPVTLRDLTQGLPTSRGKDTTPLVLQHLRDHNAPKLDPIVQRVDVVELPRLKTHLADPERQGGRDRRKEMWRIGTAMESAALLLQRARGRQVPVSVETARRAQEYLHARLPEPSGAVVEPAAAPLKVPDPANPAMHPPWLQRPPGPAPVAAKGPEVVPVSVSDDPSLRAAPARPPDAAAPSPPAPAPSAAVPPPPPVPGTAPAPGPTVGLRELAALKQSLGQDLLRLLDERLAEAAQRAPHGPTGLDAEAQKQLEERLATLHDQLRADLAHEVTQLQERLGRDQAALEIRQRDLLGALASQALDRRWVAQVEPRLQEAVARIEAAAQAAGGAAQSQSRAEVERLTAELESKLTALEARLEGSLSAQVDLHHQEAQERAEEARASLRDEVGTAVAQRIDVAEATHAKATGELETRLTTLVDGRAREVESRLLPRTLAEVERLRQDGERRLAAATAGFAAEAERARAESQDAQVRAIADLQVRLQAYTDQKLREDVERERQKYLELLARLKGEVETSLTRLLESARFETTLKEKTQPALDVHRVELERLLDTRLRGVEAAARVEVAGTLDRLTQLEASLEVQRTEVRALDDAVRAELDDLDRRAQILADRLVPVVRKTWQRITDLEKESAGGAAEEVEALEAELKHEVHRLDAELDGRYTELRDRMETAISNQGRVWLTLVRQLSQLTDDRRVIEESRALLRHRRPAETNDEATSLEALPSLLQPRSRSDDDEEDDEPPAERPRRRRRPYGRS